VKAESFSRRVFSLAEARSEMVYAIDFEVPTRVDQYTIRTARDHPERDPVGWSLLASNDGISWTTVHEHKFPDMIPSWFRSSRVEPLGWHDLPPSGLTTAAFVLVGISIFDAFAALVPMIVCGRYKTVLAGLALKYSEMCMIMLASECPAPGQDPAAGMLCKRVIKIWLTAHRMAADLMVSTLIGVPLFPFVVCDYFMSVLLGCTGSSLHQLVFRDPGHVCRRSSQRRP